MNPSSNGWIPKLLSDSNEESLIKPYQSLPNFYAQLRNTGFLYGISVGTLLEKPVSTLQLTQEELTKINLFHILFFVYGTERGTENTTEAIESLVDFYKTIEKGTPGFFKKLSFSNRTSDTLERIISARLQESNQYVKNDATSLFTYALLFADALAFRYYLNHQKGLKKYIETLEKTLIQFSIWALESKLEKNKYDLLAIEMITESTQYLAFSNKRFSEQAALQLQPLTQTEKEYVLDICCLAVWDDKQLDSKEAQFLKTLVAYLDLSEESLKERIQQLEEFSNTHATKIKLFDYKHPVQKLYKQSTATVKLLILRNKNRLLKELNESGELLKLLSSSTHRDLSSEEKTKVKEQLLDICKTVPSLTIFMLPGGALLLPLMVKLIPKLLPSAFHENRLDKQE